MWRYEELRILKLLMQGGWTLNGRTFEMTTVADWEFANDSAGGGVGRGMA